MIMASSRRQSREKVLDESPEWKRGNIGYIDPTDPVKMFHGRQHYLIHWENTSYRPSYIDCTYVQKMEDISKTKRTRYSQNEVLISTRTTRFTGRVAEGQGIGQKTIRRNEFPATEDCGR